MAESLGKDMTEKSAGLDTLHHAALRVRDVAAAVEWYTRRFRCEVEYQDATWAMLVFANVRLAFVLQAQHPPHIAVVGDPCAYGTPEQHRDGTSSVYLKDPDGNNVEILALAAAPVESET
jgi:catechol 2,3-dioxygenase-like lactoylglutathione lyase family enzyme